MPKIYYRVPDSLEDQCLRVTFSYLNDEMNLLFHLTYFKDKSLLIKKFWSSTDQLFDLLRKELHKLTGIVRDISTQKMTDMLIGILDRVIMQKHLYSNTFAVHHQQSSGKRRQQLVLLSAQHHRIRQFTLDEIIRVIIT